MITNIGWDSLHTRRLLAQSAMFHKLHYQIVNIKFPLDIVPACYISRSDHHLKYQLPIQSTDAYKYSFYPRSIRIWNKLPLSAVLLPTTPAFKGAALPFIRDMLPPPGSRLL